MILKLFGQRFLGVFASDKLPNVKNGQMYIANLDKSTEPGSHWIAIYGSNGNLYVYDSFGRNSKTIIPSIFKTGKGVKDTEYDAEQIQTEDNCGLRAMVALYMFDEFDPEVVADYL